MGLHIRDPERQGKPLLQPTAGLIDKIMGGTRIQMHAVDSENVSKIGWDPKGLYVEFHGTDHIRYLYRGVPKSGGDASYEGLLTAKSKGTYIADRVKPHFQVQKISK